MSRDNQYKWWETCRFPLICLCRSGKHEPTVQIITGYNDEEGFIDSEDIGIGWEHAIPLTVDEIQVYLDNAKNVTGKVITYECTKCGRPVCNERKCNCDRVGIQ